MEYRRLGQTGLEVSTIGLGTNNFGGRIDFEATKKVLHQTMEEGINFLDCANTYGAGKSEEFIGQVLGKEHRHEMIIATKVGNGPMGGPPPGPNQKGGTRHHILEQVDLSLKRLDTDYIEMAIAQPTQYIENRDYFAANQLVIRGLLYTMGELRCRNFFVQAKITDLNA